MTPRSPQRILILALLLGATMVGCGWRFREPPASGAGTADARFSERPVIVVGRLGNPARARVEWKDIGAGMSAALAGALRKESRYDAWVDAPLAAHVVKSLGQVGERRRRSLDAVRKTHGDVRFVVTGSVTDFAHSGDLPASLRRRDLFGRRNEAVVAIRLEVIDLVLARVVASDHIYGTANARAADAEDFYANMAFGSYLFWSTPLGKASEEAIDRTVDQIDRRLVLTRPAPASEARQRRIARQTGPRTLQLASDVDARSEGGRLYFVCLVDDPTGEHHAVFDPETGYPLKARIERTKLSLTTRTALLLGRKPPTVDLRGAMLCPVSPDGRALAGRE